MWNQRRPECLFSTSVRSWYRRVFRRSISFRSGHSRPFHKPANLSVRKSVSEWTNHPFSTLRESEQNSDSFRPDVWFGTVFACSCRDILLWSFWPLRRYFRSIQRSFLFFLVVLIFNCSEHFADHIIKIVPSCPLWLVIFEFKFIHCHNGTIDFER